MGHLMSGCPCIAAAVRRHQQQHARVSQSMADNYALATNNVICIIRMHLHN